MKKAPQLSVTVQRTRLPLQKTALFTGDESFHNACAQSKNVVGKKSLRGVEKYSWSPCTLLNTCPIWTMYKRQTFVLVPSKSLFKNTWIRQKLSNTTTEKMKTVLDIGVRITLHISKKLCMNAPTTFTRLVNKSLNAFYSFHHIGSG